MSKDVVVSLLMSEGGWTCDYGCHSRDLQVWFTDHEGVVSAPRARRQAFHRWSWVVAEEQKGWREAG